MSQDIREKRFEDEIVKVLTGDEYEDIWGESGEPEPLYDDYTAGGYLKRENYDFDIEYCMIPEDAIDFVKETQPEQWKKLEAFEDDAEEAFLKGLNREISHRGTLDVLRRGLNLPGGARFKKMAFFKPESKLNPSALEKYEKNIFSVIQQLKYREGEQLAPDLTIFLNGLPVFTIELKNPLTRQTVEDAKRQYKRDRDPRDTLFSYNRCLAHFAVDTNEVYMTTRIEGDDTVFLPFNKGNDEGSGNPPNPEGYKTDYFWKYLLTKDSLLDLVQNFITEFRKLDEKGNLTKEELLIFPRFHQLDSVRRLKSTAKRDGPGKRYLIMHSAGSGKTFTISWLAHQLASLHNKKDEPVFDSVIVMSDRRVLDDQLQHHVSQFEQTKGVVKTIKKDSNQLQRALEDGEKIVVTTIHKFSFIVGEIENIPVSNFALIIDEAHSSQTGELKDNQSKVLAKGRNLDEAEEEEEDSLAKIYKDIEKRGPLPNVSSFAFTATPKPKTLEMFGEKQESGGFIPFSLYSMSQAIEEGFILDVLQNYTTYNDYFRLLKTIEKNPEYETKKAKRLLKSFVRNHEHVISKKTKIMVEHFVEKVKHRIKGKAKAMLVTTSRPLVIKYKHAFEKYIKEKGYNIKVLAAFSKFTFKGDKYTEKNVNKGLDEPIEDRFKKDEYKIMIVANKFQTGFDQPLLHTMYVDKKLSGVAAVQTLSRINRINPDKKYNMVVDFINETETIQKAFKTFYKKTFLKRGTDPRLLYDLERQIKDFGFFKQEEVNKFIDLWYSPQTELAEIYSILNPTIDRYKASKEDEQVDFREKLNDFIRLYSFLVKVISFKDEELHKLYQYGRLLYRELPIERSDMPYEVKKHVDIEQYRIQEISSEEDISLGEGESILDPQHKSKGGAKITEKESDPLSVIIELLNEQFGYNLDEEDKIFIKKLQDRLNRNAALRNTVEKNPSEKAKMTFDAVIEKEMLDMIDQNVYFFNKTTDDNQFKEIFVDWLFNQFKKEPVKNIKELINSGENKNTEFKENFYYDKNIDGPNEENKNEVAKTVCAFANSGGGHLLIGVDKESNIKGLQKDFDLMKQGKDSFKKQLQETLKSKIGEKFVAQHIEINFEAIDSKKICVIRVEPNEGPIYFDKDEFFIRDNESNTQLSKRDAKKYIQRHF